MNRQFSLLRPGPTLRLLLILLAVALIAACDEVADGARIQSLVQERLALAMGAGTFQLTGLRRQGSGPLDADAQRRARRIVYYNAVLTFARDLDFSAWGTLNVAAFATLLGATERGVQGIRQGGNRQGDQVRVHGSLTFVRAGDTWTPVDAVHPQVGTPSEYSPGSSAQSKDRIERIRALFARETPDPKRQRQIITQELDQAYQAITLRLDRLERALLIAGGPDDGEYLGVARLLGQTLVAGGLAANAVATQGSAENLRLLREGRADLALVQNNLAREAHLGTGAFAGSEPFYGLRALASLFPEPIHVLVRPDSPIEDLHDLAGQRVEIGTPDSGSRANALLLLEAAGLALKDLTAVSETGLAPGLAALAAGKVDAVIATVSAPARVIQDAMAQGQVRLLSLAPKVQDQLAARGYGLVALALPIATYPGQRQAVQTVAVTALLVAQDGLPKADVDKTLDALFERIDFVRAGVPAGSRIERASARLGVGIPLHPAAVGLLGNGGGAAAAGP